MTEQPSFSNEQLQTALDAAIESTKRLVEELEDLRAASRLAVLEWESTGRAGTATQWLKDKLLSGSKMPIDSEQSPHHP